MCDYDYRVLKALMDEYAGVTTQDAAELFGRKIDAYLKEDDRSRLNHIFHTYTYGTEFSEGTSTPIPLYPQLYENIAALKGIMLKLDRPLDDYTFEELKNEFLILFKSQHIDLLKNTHESNAILENLVFVANTCDVRHSQTEEYAERFNGLIPSDVQITLLIEGIKTMRNQEFDKTGTVFVLLGDSAKKLLRQSNLNPNSSDKL